VWGLCRSGVPPGGGLGLGPTEADGTFVKICYFVTALRMIL